MKNEAFLSTENSSREKQPSNQSMVQFSVWSGLKLPHFAFSLLTDRNRFRFGAEKICFIAIFNVCRFMFLFCHSRWGKTFRLLTFASKYMNVFFWWKCRLMAHQSIFVVAQFSTFTRKKQAKMKFCFGESWLKLVAHFLSRLMASYNP